MMTDEEAASNGEDADKASGRRGEDSDLISRLVESVTENGVLPDDDAQALLDASFRGEGVAPSRSGLTDEQRDLVIASGQRITACYRDLLIDTGAFLRSISDSELEILFLLDTYPGNVTREDIARRIPLTRPRITQIVDTLVDKGYVIRQPDADDGRKTDILITEAGKAAAASRRSVICTLFENLCLLLGPKRTQEYVRMLEMQRDALHQLDLDLPARIFDQL